MGVKTVGVRALVFNEQGQVLLVQHTYTPGWHFPGGGVDHKETTKQAALREAYEEAGIETHDEPTLMGVYHQTIRGADDYVVLYLIHSFIQHKAHSPEIAEVCWGDPDKLPEGTTDSTKRRLDEYLSGIVVSDKW
jgi:8-oxo-dGTP pyrophosphatase MutT (NUDIX family)